MSIYFSPSPSKVIIVVALFAALLLLSSASPKQAASPFFVAAACSSNGFTFDNGTCVECLWHQYPENLACVEYSSVADKMAWDRSATISNADTGFMTIAAGGVLIMTPALSLFYGAMASEGNVMNTVLLSIVSMATISLAWFLVGYSIAFGPGTNFWGSLEWATMLNVGANPSGCYATTIPHLLFFAFQCMFAIITPALISGAIVGRMTFISYCIFITVWSICVYCPIVRWVWSFRIDEVSGAIVPNGWLGAMGVIDFAGGAPIHIAAAAAALAASLIVGERLVKKDAKVDVTKLVVGTSLLWFGWTFGFNGGSAGAASKQAATAFLNSHIATCTAVVVWMVIEFLHTGKATLVGVCTACVIGLVAITPSCGFISPQSSVAFGGIPALGCYAFSVFKTKYLSKYLDDTLDVFVCHGVSAFIAMFLLGIFADARVGGTNGAMYGNPKQIGIQLAAACTALVYSFSMSCAILLILKYTIGIRVSEEEEINGLDAGHEQLQEDDSVYAPKDDDTPIAVIFTDIERSSALWVKRPTLMQRVLELHNKIVKKCVQKHKMYIVKTIGDAFMVVGSSAAAALRFAADVQADLYAEVWDMPEFELYYKNWRLAVLQDKGSDALSGDPTSAKSGGKTATHKDALWNGIRVRVGGHWGPCNVAFDQLTKRYDYFSTTVNIAARIESAGHGGQSIVSLDLWAAAKAADSKVTSELVNAHLGEVHLRGIRDPVTLIQVLPLNLGLRKFPPLRLDKGVNSRNNHDESAAAFHVDSAGGSKRSHPECGGSANSHQNLYQHDSHSEHDDDGFPSPALLRASDIIGSSNQFNFSEELVYNNQNNNNNSFSLPHHIQHQSSVVTAVNPAKQQQLPPSQVQAQQNGAVNHSSIGLGVSRVVPSPGASPTNTIDHNNFNNNKVSQILNTNTNPRVFHGSKSTSQDLGDSSQEQQQPVSPSTSARFGKKSKNNNSAAALLPMMPLSLTNGGKCVDVGVKGNGHMVVVNRGGNDQQKYVNMEVEEEDIE